MVGPYSKSRTTTSIAKVAAATVYIHVESHAFLQVAIVVVVVLVVVVGVSCVIYRQELVSAVPPLVPFNAAANLLGILTLDMLSKR